LSTCVPMMLRWLVEVHLLCFSFRCLMCLIPHALHRLPHTANQASNRFIRDPDLYTGGGELEGAENVRGGSHGAHAPLAGVAGPAVDARLVVGKHLLRTLALW
jgi:hypothetical protein